jgi:hypothetical protein
MLPSTTVPDPQPDPQPAPHSGADATPRRPPRPPAGWATVTRLGLGSRRSDRPVPLAPTEGSLALQVPPGGHPAETPDADPPPSTPVLHVLPGGREQHEELSAWATRFAQGVVEVLGGDRPVTQLVRWTSARVYADLDRRVRVRATQQAVLAAHPHGVRPRQARAQVRSVHVCLPTDTAAEISVHVRHGVRSRALAARLELRRGRWQCTALQLG